MEQEKARGYDRMAYPALFDESPKIDTSVISWLMTPRCEECHDPSVVLIRIQYPDESARYYCLRCRPLTFIVER